MKSLPVGEFKAQFSAVSELIKKGETVEVVYGKKKEPLGYFVPANGFKPVKKRKLGILEGKASVVFADDFKMTEEEFINLR